MRKLDARGEVNIFLILFIITFVMLLASFGFGIWAYSGMQDYKNNTQAKIDTAVQVAQQETSTEKDNEFIQREKKPLKEYAAPSAAGSLKVQYPKTWSAYIDERSTSKLSLSGYFSPNFVADEDNKEATYALRIEVVNKSFDRVVDEYDSVIDQGKLRAKPYKPANVSNTPGLELQGEIDNDTQGTMVLIQLRDKTIKIWTEGDQFRSDLFDHVLETLTFSP